METIEVKLDEPNELYFNVHVEGSSVGIVNVRLLCEGEDVSTIFAGKYLENGEVKVMIPEMKKNSLFKENKDYVAKLEVMIENRYFIPLQFGLRFKESVKVFAEVSQKTVSNTIKEQSTFTHTSQPQPAKQPEVKKPAVTANIVVKKSSPTQPAPQQKNEHHVQKLSNELEHQREEVLKKAVRQIK